MDAVQGSNAIKIIFLLICSIPALGSQGRCRQSVSQLSGLFNTGELWLFPRNISRVCAPVRLPVLGGVSHSVHQRGLCALVLLPNGLV